jgi:Flp pilus assembly protein TadG
MRWRHPWRFRLARHPRPLDCHGSVAAEFALAAPVVILIAVGIADFGMLAAKSAGLASSTRIGAEYARVYPLDIDGIQRSTQRAMSFAPALILPATFPRRCECDDASPIACNESCATVGRPAPNRVFITVSASQPFTPLVPWPGIPATLTAATEMRMQ